MGKLLGIAIKNASKAPMLTLDDATITIESGVENDFRGEPGERQVSLLSNEVWSDVCSQLQKELPWTTRRANLLVEGLTLMETEGFYIHIGSVVLKITGETIPCRRMDELHSGLKEALIPLWKSGVVCEVKVGGRVAVGDEVVLSTSEFL